MATARSRKQAPRSGNLIDSRFEERRPRPGPTGSADAGTVTTEDEEDMNEM
jgi:hypothetical protein